MTNLLKQKLKNKFFLSKCKTRLFSHFCEITLTYKRCTSIYRIDGNVIRAQPNLVLARSSSCFDDFCGGLEVLTSSMDTEDKNNNCSEERTEDYTKFSIFRTYMLLSPDGEDCIKKTLYCLRAGFFWGLLYLSSRN